MPGMALLETEDAVWYRDENIGAELMREKGTGGTQIKRWKWRPNHEGLEARWSNEMFCNPVCLAGIG